MAWKTKTIDRGGRSMIVATETVTLGAAKGNRYTSEIDFIPPGANFVVISNTAATNLSGSASDQLYAAYESGGTYYQVKNTLRDGNYADDTNQGTSFRSIDNTSRNRYVDKSYVGEHPFYKIRVLQAAVESSSKTVGVAVIVGAVPAKNNKWD